MQDHRTRIIGNKREGYEAECLDCDWRSLGTYVLTREGMESECRKHVLHVKRSAAFDALEAGDISQEEWRERVNDVNNKLQAA